VVRYCLLNQRLARHWQRAAMARTLSNSTVQYVAIQKAVIVFLTLF
jgi:hypothetical protein